MSKTLCRQVITVLLFIVGIHSSITIAQVTIGSNLEPSPLSLLDLKENNPAGNNANSTRGLGLPRVKLTDKNNLYPMFEASAGYNGQNKDTQDAKHTGLVVYNLNGCDGFGPGVYVWVGKEWEPLAIVNIVQEPGINITDPSDSSIIKKLSEETYLVHLPSGKDLRSFPADKKFSITLNWIDPASGNLTIPDISTLAASSAALPGPDGGLKFTGNPAGEWAASPVTGSPVIFHYGLNDMSDIITSDNALASNPFRSRETAVTFEVPANDCYPETRQLKVRLNQTNYRLTISKDNWAFNTFGYRLRDKAQTSPESKVHYYRLLITEMADWGDTFNFNIQSNARWKSEYKATTSGIISNINVPNQGGQEIIDGATPPDHYATPTYNTGVTGNRYKEAGYIIFSDTAASQRYYPIEMHIVQCRADSYDDSGIGDASVVSEANWGRAVLKHKDQNGNGFLSAVFESAGRWMSTNLAAMTYDTDSPLAGTTLTAFTEKKLEDHYSGRKEYAYPQPKYGDTSNPAVVIGDWGTEPSGWQWEEGLFYNWYAATGRNYIDNDTVNEANSKQEPLILIQGICPNGWHLPSDQEWSELEKAVYSDIGKFSTYDETDLAGWTIPGRGWNTQWDLSTGLRGDPVEDGHVGHAGVMKNVCPPRGSAFAYLTASKGYSKEPASGGFNVILVGRIRGENNGDPTSYLAQRDRGWDTEFWSVSQSGSSNAWFRGLNLENGGVDRNAWDKTRLVSVRCKKND